MGYTKMRLEYFQLLEKLLDNNVFIKMYLDDFKDPVIEVVKYTELGEEILIKSDIKNSVSPKILDLIHEMSTRLNGGEPLFPQYAKKNIRGKTLDNVLFENYQIYFYKLVDGQVLGVVAKYDVDDLYDIFITTNSTLKEAFEALDYEIYKRFSYFPNLIVKEEGTLDNYAKKLILKRREEESKLTPYRC